MSTAYPSATPGPSALDGLRELAARHPGGVIDCMLGTPCDAVPAFVTAAVRDAVAQSGPYPMSPGAPRLRGAAGDWINQRFATDISVEQVAACIGTKEFVASVALHLGLLGESSRDTVLYPSVAYPTYAVGAMFAGCRAVAVPVDDNWLLDLDAIDPDDVRRARLLWLNVPGNPTGSTADLAHFERVAEWGRRHGVVVVSDECYVDFAPEPHSILEAGSEGVLAIFSLSKRSNFAGMRAGFYAGDSQIVAGLIALRREAGMMLPTPIQAAAAAALGDHNHVQTQCKIYERRRSLCLDRLATHGIRHRGGAMPMYLWLRSDSNEVSGFELAEQFARAGWLVAPGAMFGSAGNDFVRIALVQPDGVLETALNRFDAVCLP